MVINPELVYAKGKYIVQESCLSIPGKEFTVRRAKIVKIRGLTLDNVMRTFRGRDLLAQVFQHELNHIDGILIDQIGERR
ncbi:Peptide deformylase [subsurface metagenome]